MSFRCEDCGTSIPGGSSAYVLSRLYGWKNRPGCYAHCKCGYPVRSKDIRDNIFTEEVGKGESNTYAYYFIYCENSSGQGHVYFGTFTHCDEGNGVCARDMCPLKVYREYRTTKELW